MFSNTTKPCMKKRKISNYVTILFTITLNTKSEPIYLLVSFLFSLDLKNKVHSENI